MVCPGLHPFSDTLFKGSVGSDQVAQGEQGERHAGVGHGVHLTRVAAALEAREGTEC